MYSYTPIRIYNTKYRKVFWHYGPFKTIHAGHKNRVARGLALPTYRYTPISSSISMRDHYNAIRLKHDRAN